MTDSISRRSFMQAGAATAGALALADVASGNPSSTRQPNVLFIMTDQQRYDAVGANGNSIIQTPQLDALARQSTNFSHAFVQAPVCVPSRASFFTGRYAHAHKNRVNYTPLDRQTVLLPTRLQSAGYATALVGKLHLFYQYPPSVKNARKTGFDTVELHDGTPRTDRWSTYAEWRQQRDPLRKVRYRTLAKDVPEIAKTLPPGTNPFRCAIDEQWTDTSWTGLRTCETLKKLSQGDQPFFLYSSFWKPHSPFEVSVPFDSIYNDVDFHLPKSETLESLQKLPLPLQKLILRGDNPPYDMDQNTLQWIYRSYYASITHIDREVGKILSTLEETGQAENTIVVFTSDHGDQLLEHGLMGKNTFFEASIRVPLMIRLPQNTQGRQIDGLTETIDVFPTVLELCGLKIPQDCHGQSLAAAVQGNVTELPERDAVFSENIIPEVITNGGLDFHFEKGAGIKGIRHPDAKMIRTKRWKFNYYPEGYAELYDLQNDPLEQENLAELPSQKERVLEFKERILNWLITATETDQIAPRWMV